MLRYSFKRTYIAVRTSAYRITYILLPAEINWCMRPYLGHTLVNGLAWRAQEQPEAVSSSAPLGTQPLLIGTITTYQLRLQYLLH